MVWSDRVNVVNTVNHMTKAKKRLAVSLSGEVNYMRLIGEVDSPPLVITAQSLEALSRWAP